MSFFFLLRDTSYWVVAPEPAKLPKKIRKGIRKELIRKRKRKQQNIMALMHILDELL